jgi:glycosyltransferase involved in cell wall biosynthesis
MSSGRVYRILDTLSFPFFMSSVLSAAVNKTRPVLDYLFSRNGKFRGGERTLWLSDTLEDSNGVAMVLKSMLQEVRSRDLPIDFLVASSTLQSGDHLIVVPPISQLSLPFYRQQPIRMPNILTLRKLFRNGNYSRIICSTEGPMGLMTLYLKYAFSVPAYFYVHTDWMTFAEKVLGLSAKNINRMQRALRAFYRAFDGLFVLNTEQQKWLTGSAMGFDSSRVFLTAHWADEGFTPRDVDKKKVLGVDRDMPVLLFAGRVSEEKGVMELPWIMEKVRESLPNAKIAIAGMGPAEKALREAMPDAIYLGWVDHDKLPEVYSAADMLVLPSRFDTFGCVVLEALSCGLPVIAYDTKGPKDILLHGVNGYLAKTRNAMAAGIVDYLSNAKLRRGFRRESLRRARDYDPDTIIRRFMSDLTSAA